MPKSAVFEKNFSKKYPLHSFGQRVPKCTPKIAYLTEKFSKKYFYFSTCLNLERKKLGDLDEKICKKTKAFFLKQEKDFQASVFYTLKGIFCISKQIIYPIGFIVINSLLTLHPKGYRIIIDNYDKEQ